MKNILIALLVIAVVVLGYLYFGKNNSNAPFDTNVSTGQSVQKGNEAKETYNGSKFSFNYPREYVLTQTNDVITITSVPIPTVSPAACAQLEEEARSACLNPQNQLSPNIKITFTAGNSEDLWDAAIFGNNTNESYRQYVRNEIKNVSLGNQTYQVYYMGGEYGGHAKYGLLHEKGLLLATYTHRDMEGGQQFSHMESDKYKLDRHQQKQLLEQILSSLEIK